MMHQRSHKTADSLPIVVGLCHKLPNGLKDASSRVEIGLIHLELEVAHLSTKRRRHHAAGKGHGKTIEECHTEDLKIIGKRDGSNDGTRPKKSEHPGLQLLLDEVEVDAGLSAQNETEAMVVDGKRRTLLNDVTKHLPVAMQDAQFLTNIYMFAQKLVVRFQDVVNPREIHQFRLFFHKISRFDGAKIMKNWLFTLFL